MTAIFTAPRTSPLRHRRHHWQQEALLGSARWKSSLSSSGYYWCVCFFGLPAGQQTAHCVPAPPGQRLQREYLSNFHSSPASSFCHHLANRHFASRVAFRCFFLHCLIPRPPLWTYGLTLTPSLVECGHLLHGEAAGMDRDYELFRAGMRLMKCRKWQIKRENAAAAGIMIPPQSR